MADSSTYNNQIDHVFNYDNVFLRTVGIALGKTLSKGIRWINRFQDGTKIRVLVPFYMSMVGEDRFVLDTFVDDIVDRRVDLNTCQIPRGIITFTNSTSDSTQMANPNEYLSQKGKINDELRRIVSKVKAVPLTINYELTIIVSSELDADKCVQKIYDTLFNYMFFRIDYYGMSIDAFFKLPDDKTIEINREGGVDVTDIYKKITFSLSVMTYYPVFKVNIDDLEVCDNDDKLNWDYLGVPRPTKDYCESIKGYYAAHGQAAVCNMNRVFWKNYYWRLQDEPLNKPTTADGKPDVKAWKKYNL